ncbi:MAG: hypothetical protein IKX06_02065 [Clostridia bacterium]|nr:hypothetical protein [Clostridia bacterium]
MRKRSVRAAAVSVILSAVIILSAVFSGCAKTGGKTSLSTEIPEKTPCGDVFTEAPTSGEPREYVFTEIEGDWPYYATAEELTTASDSVFKGKLTDISFVTAEVGGYLLKNSFYTVYTVEVEKTYKGEDVSVRRILKPGGIEGYNEQEQAEVLAAAGLPGNTIPCIKNIGRLTLGNEYLFCVTKRTDTSDNIVNPSQFVFDLNSENAIGVIEYCEKHVTDT